MDATVVGSIAIKVLPDTSDFRNRLRRELARISPEILVKVDLDEHDVRKVKDRLDDIEDEDYEATVGVDLDSAYARARLAALTRPRQVKIFANVDSAAMKGAVARLAGFATGGSAVRKVLKDIWDNLKNIDKNVPKISFITLAIGALTIAATALLSNLFALSKSLAQIGKLGLLIPGFLGSIAIGVAALIGAMMDFNKQLPQVFNAVKSIRKTISANFWSEAKAPLSGFFNDLIPIFRTGMAKVGTEMGQGMAVFANELKSTMNPAVAQMFADLHNAIDIAEGSAKGIAQQITVFGQVGASYLPNFAQWFVDINTSFGQFLTDAQASGELYTWMDQGIDSLKALGSVIASTASIFTSLARAADEAGGSSIQQLAARMREIADAAKSEGFQSGLVAYLTAMHDAMGRIRSEGGPGVMAFLEALSANASAIFVSIGDAFGQLVGELTMGMSGDDFMGGLVSAAEGIRSMIAGLAPALAPLTSAFGAIMTLVGGFAAQLGPLLASILGPLSGLISSLVPQILPVITMLTSGLTGAMGALMPAIMPLADMLVGTLGQALQALLPPVLGLVAGLAPLVQMLGTALTPILSALAAIFAKVGAALAPLVQKLLSLLTAILGPLLAMLGPLIAELLGPIGDAITQVVEALSPLLDVLTEIVGGLMPIILPIVKLLVGVLGDMVKGFVTGIANIVKGLANLLGGLVKVIKGVFTGDWSSAGEGLKQMLLGLWEIIKGVFLAIINILPIGRLKVLAKAAGKIFASIGGVIMKVLGPIGRFFARMWNGWVQTVQNLGGKLLGGFAKIGSGIANWAKGLFDNTVGAVSDIWLQLKSMFTGGGGAKGFLAGLKNIADTIWQTMTSPFRRLIVWVEQKLANLFSPLTDAVHRAKETLRQFLGLDSFSFGDIFRTLWAAIAEVPVRIHGAVTQIPGRLKAALDNAWNFVKGFLRELVEGFGERLTGVRVKIEEIPGLIRQAFSDMFGWLVDLGKSLGKLFVEDVKALVRPFLNLGKLIGKGVSKGFNGLKNLISKAMKKVAEPVKNAVKNILRYFNDLSGGRLAKIVNPMVNFFKRIQHGFKRTVAFVKTFARVFQKDPKKAMEFLAREVKRRMKDIIDRIQKLPGETKDKLLEWTTVMVNIGKDVIQGLVDGIKDGAAKVRDVAIEIKDWFVNKFKEIFGIHSPSRVMLDMGKDIIQGLINGLKDLLGNVWSTVTDIGSGLLDKFTGVFKDLVSKIKSGTGNAKKAMGSGLSGVTSGVKDWGKKVSSEMTKASAPLGKAPLKAAKSASDGVASQLNKVVKAIKGLAGNIKSAASNLNTSTLYKNGQNVVQGLINGMESKRRALRNKSAQVGGDIPSAANYALEIRSPSRVMMRTGAFAVDGLIEGLNSRAAGAVSATRAIAAEVTDAFDAEMSAPAFEPLLNKKFDASVETAMQYVDERPVYVQNPFTGEYLVARVDERVDQGFYVRENMR